MTKKITNQPVLTIAVPAYNVSQFLKRGINSLLSHNMKDKMEVIIIDDGSSDDTLDIAKYFETIPSPNGKQIVKVVSKTNGGHGSAINLGIQLATGKYFKLMDGDDFFDEKQLPKLINILETEQSDIVLTDYSEVYADSTKLHHIRPYLFMEPGHQYELDEFGFSKNTVGPLLSTTSCKTELLHKSDFKIDENCYYVDMEYNYMTYLIAKNIAYYPLDIYRYSLDIEGQSMSIQSLAKNHLQHERVCLRLMDEFEKSKDSLSDNKRSYLATNLIIPLCNTQYMILAEYIRDPKKFISFDNKVKKYPEFYNHPEIVGLIISLHRKTNGLTIPANNMLRGCAKLLRNLIKVIIPNSLREKK